MQMWHVYALDTGLFTGAAFSMSPPDPQRLAAHTPAGCALRFGQFDHLAQRVDVTTGEVVDWQPPAPADNAYQAWHWDAPSRRWVDEPTPAAIAARCRDERAGRLSACDWTQLADTALDPSAKAAWALYRQQLRDLPLHPDFPHTVAWPVPPA